MKRLCFLVLFLLLMFSFCLSSVASYSTLPWGDAPLGGTKGWGSYPFGENLGGSSYTFETFNVSDGDGGFEAFRVSDGAGGFEDFNVVQ